jgi:transcriptional regulator with XRE-family HTH domain
VTASSFRLISGVSLAPYSDHVTPLERARESFTGNPGRSSRARYIDASDGGEIDNWSYRAPVPETAPGRKIAFAAFVRKALEDARSTRAWTGSEVSRRTGVSRQTVNRWVRGEWSSDPEAERVVAFCTGLGINPTVAFGVLGWDRATPARPAPAAPPMDPDVEALLRRLVDPNVSEVDKFHIRETIRYLAYRPLIATESRKRRGRAG